MASKTPLPMPPREELVGHYERGLSYPQLCEIYGVALGTMSKWFKIYGIKARIPLVEKKVIDGKVYRKCFGPLHDETNCWLPLEKFWKNRAKSGGTRPRCAECKGVKQRVKFTPVYRGWVESIVRRVGVLEACRRLGIHDKTLRAWRSSKHPHALRREHAIAIVSVLSELKLTEEVRHRDSIHRGATVRGEEERVVRRSNDLYHRATGSYDTEYKQRRRQDPEFRKRDNEGRKVRARRSKQAHLTDAE